MRYTNTDAMSQRSLSSSSTYSSNSSSTGNNSFGPSQFTLTQVLSNPKMLHEFEFFLRQSWSHESLLFIEAMTQLRHETETKTVENSLHRIYKTFLAPGSPFELNVTTQDQVREDIRSLQWAIVDRVDAVAILEETEIQVLDMLNTKLFEFLQFMDIPTKQANLNHVQNYQVRVVIVGGGFTGFTVASILDQMPRFYVTLIDTKDSFEYTPGIVKKIVNPEQSSSLRVRHDAYVKNGRVIIGYAEHLSNKGKTISVNNEIVEFDYLVVATGSAYSSQLKSTDTSSLYRMTGLEESYFELLKAHKVLIIGGGLVGCELASEISQHQFPGPHPNKKITLVDSHPNVVNRSDAHQQNMALKYLQNLGVEVVCNERILDFDTSNQKSYLGSSGRVYSGYDKVFIATGTRPNSTLFGSATDDHSLDSCIDAWGRIKVKPTLQIDHYKYDHIFAGGDVTNVVEEKTGYAATISGVCIARNICRLVKGKTPLKQGTKGTLPAPLKPLHGMLENGGIGKQNLNALKKRFSFLNPSWAALKYFDEQQFLKIVQGQGTIHSSQVLGRLPRKLDLPSKSTSLLQHARAMSTNSSVSSKASRQTHSASTISNLSRGNGQTNINIQADMPTTNTIPVRSVSKHSLMKNRAAIQQRRHHEQTHSFSSSAGTSIEEESERAVREFSFEKFTYGDEDIQLFSPTYHPVKNISSPLPHVVSQKNQILPEAASYGKGFSLSPRPAARRRASLTTSFDRFSIHDSKSQPNIKLTRSASFSSITKTA
ncbi:hypothetical protein EDC96DRAFT_606765 [Choanephora cucurbitarum]|nr:hypothetical protein EDC96DRAFT_606765 [Choanephora cucurbitarum]